MLSVYPPTDLSLSSLLEPGYAATKIILVEAALCVLQERNKIVHPLQDSGSTSTSGTSQPSAFVGGVLTPALALHHTSLKDRLQKAGITFEVVNKDF